MDYSQIEAEAFDFLNAQVPEITTWSRGWTNGGRREIQRAHSFPEMLRLYPEEADMLGSSGLVASLGSRRVAMPSLFKEFRSREGDLWRIEPTGGSEHVPLVRWEFSEIMEKYDLNAVGTPEVFHMIWSGDGTSNVFVDLYPKPDATYYLRLLGYFYLADLADGGISGSEDFLSKLDPFLVRDFIAREALVKLEMWDSAAVLSQNMAQRMQSLAHDAKAREIERSGILVPRLGVREGRGFQDMGYPFWGKR